MIPSAEVPRPNRPARWPWIAAIIAALVIGFVTGLASGGRPGGEPAAQAAAGSSQAPGTTRTTVPTTTTTTAPLPTPDMFTITVKVIEKKCFGSAGCNVTYQIEPTYTGTRPLPTSPVTVVYEVLGGDDPQTNRFTVTGDRVKFDSEESIQTPKSSSVLTAKVTAVM